MVSGIESEFVQLDREGHIKLEFCTLIGKECIMPACFGHLEWG